VKLGFRSVNSTGDHQRGIAKIEYPDFPSIGNIPAVTKVGWKCGLPTVGYLGGYRGHGLIVSRTFTQGKKKRKSAMFILNAWYVAAWTHDVGAEPIGRRICDQPIVLFRDGGGAAVALTDRCAHRGFPLSAGTVCEGMIRCGYHGFGYDADGACRLVPGQTNIATRLAVRSYPVAERDGWIWVWPGDASLADPTTIPDTHWMNDPAWSTVTHSVHFECRAELIHDNLLDLTHETFLHASTVGDEYIVDHPLTVTVDGTVVTADRLMPGVVPPPLYLKTTGWTDLCDRFHCTEFFAPSLHVLHSGITGQGRPREEGCLIKVLNGITPIDANTSWYFYAFCRNFAVDNHEATAELAEGLGVVLREDASALALQAIGLRGRPDNEHDILVAHDSGLVKARRVMEKLLAAES
jgi:phenylpropionate dioxygenase-like ring-hydroxylating dioxygenase large terminal subunit